MTREMNVDFVSMEKFFQRLYHVPTDNVIIFGVLDIFLNTT